MKRFFWLFVMVLILIGIFSTQIFGVNSADPNPVSFNIVQLDWVGGAGTISNSRIGEVRFTGYSPEITNKLNNNIPVFLNIGFYNNVAPTPQWIVRNLYVTLDKPGCLFGLGNSSTSRIAWSDNRVSMMITDYPIDYEEYIADQTFNDITVTQESYCRGGFTEADVEGILGPWVGCSVPSIILPTPTPIRWNLVTIGKINPRGTILDIDEAYCHCVPGSIARSIQYMASLNCWKVDDPKTMEAELATDMGTNEYPPPTCGTYITAPLDHPDYKNAIDGKKQYARDHNLPITTTLVVGVPSNMNSIMNSIIYALNTGGDVEVGINRNNQGGHRVMVKKIIVYPDGSFDIIYIEDNQGNGIAESIEKVIHVEPDGTLPGLFLPSGYITSFIVETFTGASRCTPTIRPTPTIRVTPTATTTPTPTRRITPTPPRRVVTPTPTP